MRVKLQAQAHCFIECVQEDREHKTLGRVQVLECTRGTTPPTGPHLSVRLQHLPHNAEVAIADVQLVVVALQAVEGKSKQAVA